MDFSRSSTDNQDSILPEVFISSAGDNQIVTTPTKCNTSPPVDERYKNRNRDKCKRYRERLKNEKQQQQRSEISDGNDPLDSINNKQSSQEDQENIKRRNREKMRRYRKRMKLNHEPREELEDQENIKLRNREKMRRYRERMKLDREREEEVKKKNRDRSQKNRDQRTFEKQKTQLQDVLFNQHTENTSNSLPAPIAKENIQTSIDQAAEGPQEVSQISVPSTYNGPFRVYNERNVCAQSKVNLYNDRNIPSMPPGNCLFYSLLKILGLDMSPLDLRRELRESRFLQLCGDPYFTRAILFSDNEFGDMDCLYIFAKLYDKNICVHLHYTDSRTTKEIVTFCHFNINNSMNFIHLHLRDAHFTPYIAIDEMIPLDVRNTQGNDEVSKIEVNDGVYEIEVKDELNKNDTNDAIDEDNVPAISNVTSLIYTNYYDHCKAHLDFYKNFIKNTFGHSCAVCDRLWCENDLKTSSEKHKNILKKILPNYKTADTVKVCSTCKAALDKRKIPILSTYNGFSYPKIPSKLPKLDIVSKRLISPRIPFMQIRRLRHVHDQYDIYGQIINVPVEVDTMVSKLPRNIEDDHCFYVHIEKKLIHRTSYIHGLIKKQNIKEWLKYLVTTPLYVHHDITIDNKFFNQRAQEITIDDVSERIPIEETVIAQQQTLMFDEIKEQQTVMAWNEDKFLHTAPGERQRPISIPFDEYAEELSFPTIYAGQFRTYRDNIKATPFMQATSELRRTDRRGADPEHLLYMATKIMRQRVRDSVSDIFKHFGDGTNITKEQVQSESFINDCIDNHLAFLRSIPNSAWYWTDRKKDLFAMLRQLGAPTAIMTLSANETGWNDLLKLLYKLRNSGGDISDEILAEMTDIDKATLVNDDAVSCAIYFNKLVNCLLNILQTKTKSPFGKYKVLHYFKRIEFQHRGSPRAHILLWLDNTPADLQSNDEDVIKMIDKLISVSTSEASGNMNVQTHKHTFTCYKKLDPNEKETCRFGAPFMPTKKTIRLIPMLPTDADFSGENFKKYKEQYKLLRRNLENIEYTDFTHFYTHNNISSDQHYYDIIRAGITRPQLFYRRTPSEKWYNSYNPFVLHHLKSNMDFQIIQDEYACAAYVVEYMNKYNKGMSDLQRQIIQTMEKNPEFNIAEITKKMSVDLLDSVEMSAQEAAWFLLREPMAESSVAITYIPTTHPTKRQRIKKTMKELESADDDCNDIWKENCFDKYEKRPDTLNNVTLAQFVAKYYINNKGRYAERQQPKVIRYRNYDIAKNYNDYRREMVLLHIPFKSEEDDVLAKDKFLKIYEDNENLIMQRRKEFEANLDIEKTIQLCKQLCSEDENNDENEESRNQANLISERDPHQRSILNPHSHVNADARDAALSKFGVIAKKMEDLMDRQQFFDYMGLENEEKKNLLLYIIYRLQATIYYKQTWP